MYRFFTKPFFHWSSWRLPRLIPLIRLWRENATVIVSLRGVPGQQYVSMTPASRSPRHLLDSGPELYPTFVYPG